MRTDNLQHFFHDCQYRVVRELQAVINTQYQEENPFLSETLIEATLHSVTNGGKRLRPGLIYATALTIKPDMHPDKLDMLAAAVEAVHCYSLVHDDLPAMDNDDLRRGKPTCHVAFDEATAILVGDGLQALGFEMLANCEDIPAKSRLEMVQVLAKAIGNKGMVLGQSLDLYAESHTVSLEQLEYIHEKKTGALIRASVSIGAIAAGADKVTRQSLDQYARCIGLAFQIQDDILDIESETAVLGKKQGADIELNKSTYPALMDLKPAKDKASQLIIDAKKAIESLPSPHNMLASIANFIIEREY